LIAEKLQLFVFLSAGQMTDSVMLTFTLRRLRASVVLLAPFVKLQRKFLRQVLTIFGGADKAPRLQALLFIRHMAAMLPPPALELALKVRFLSYQDAMQTVHANRLCKKVLLLFRQVLTNH